MDVFAVYLAMDCVESWRKLLENTSLETGMELKLLLIASHHMMPIVRTACDEPR